MKLYGNDEINFIRNELYEISAINFDNEPVNTAAIRGLRWLQAAWLWDGYRNDLAERAMSSHSRDTNWSIEHPRRGQVAHW